MNLCRHFLLRMLPSSDKHVMEGNYSSAVLARYPFRELCLPVESCDFWRLHRPPEAHQEHVEGLLLPSPFFSAPQASLMELFAAHTRIGSTIY